MRISGIIKNDIAAAPGVCVSVFVQGCHRHCVGCHNPETWDFNDGRLYTIETYNEIKTALIANKVHRDLCIMGGEPLDPENIRDVAEMVRKIREDFDHKIRIYIWTGYTYGKDLIEEAVSKGADRYNYSLYYSKLLSMTDYLIDGEFIESQRDITLHMRGSKNQRIIPLNNNPTL